MLVAANFWRRLRKALGYRKSWRAVRRHSFARPKSLRFRLFNLAGRITRSGRSFTLHLAAGHPFASALVEARRILLELARVPPPAAASP